MTEYVAVSNTGKTITVSLSRDFYDRWAGVVPLDANGRPHVDIEFDAFGGIIKITPGTFGRRVGRHTNGNGGAYVGLLSKVFPEWPMHGKVEYTDPYFDAGTGVLILTLPSVLPAPSPRNVTAKGTAHDSRADYSRDGFTTRKKDPVPAQKPGWANAGPFDLPPAEQVLIPAPELIAAATRNVLIELEGQSFTFNVPLRLRLKILSLLQADPNVKGDAPIGFD